MSSVNYQFNVSDDYVPPVGPIATDLEYVTFVMNMAARSYKTQYNAPDVNAGIDAARLAYNASLPPESAPE